MSYMQTYLSICSFSFTQKSAENTTCTNTTWCMYAGFFVYLRGGGGNTAPLCYFIFFYYGWNYCLKRFRKVSHPCNEDCLHLDVLLCWSSEVSSTGGPLSASGTTIYRTQSRGCCSRPGAATTPLESQKWKVVWSQHWWQRSLTTHFPSLQLTPLTQPLIDGHPWTAVTGSAENCNKWQFVSILGSVGSNHNFLHYELS